MNPKGSKQLKIYACLSFSGFEYEFFVDYEAAIEWLSDISEIGMD
jgi:hypothetical protein